MNKIKLLEATQGKPVWVWRTYWSWRNGEYLIYTSKNDIGTFGDIYELCSEDFERFTGLKLNPGEYTRIRFGVSPV